ncbi:phosphatase PAP2 family protein [Armatimonas rosea]|uniref:Membrane-associated phospholipid phosphatase n=1 Tax=Armatimonas rosea TaxID=685828 RepID=A0A7W9SUZ1_ARMRO|nr:phosphatase PAP2 family protein [Armatimonas rosea]MBB6052424.1 membrane-associated phospholipid phosphatase [Armatimonas rosea]
MRIFLAAGIAALTLALAPRVQAQTGLPDRPTARFFSGSGNVAFLAGGLLASDRREGVRALVTSTVVVTGLKYSTRERRPDGSTHDSFPSGHASAAFTIAGMAAARAHSGTEAALWYLGAGLIADSRVTLKRHYPHDVVVGGLLGLLVARSPALRLRF